MQGLTFAELTEDEEHQDVTFLSGETGEDPLHITFLITAHRLAERTDIAPEVFYGLLRNDLPSNLSALLIQDPGLVRRSLEMAAADNKGITKHEFMSIMLRVCGIKQDAPLSFWTKRYKHRLEFPEKIIGDEVKPNNWNYIFVEPGVTQHLSYITIIDAEIKYITTREKVNYEVIQTA